MPLISPDAAAHYAKERIKVKEETITRINEFLVDETSKNAGRGVCTTIISDNQLDGNDPHLIAYMLKTKGWNVTYQSDQRDGAWLCIELPAVNIET